jgi:hypothetical protein
MGVGGRKKGIKKSVKKKKNHINKLINIIKKKENRVIFLY